MAAALLALALIAYDARGPARARCAPMRSVVARASTQSPSEQPPDEGPAGRRAGLGATPDLSCGAAGSRASEARVELWLINFYKDWISPVLPRACRFVPTCSSYGIQAYEGHGAARGFVLLAWRILRCNPLGGSGFDPPRWPPPAWGAGSSSWWRETPFWREAGPPDDGLLGGGGGGGGGGRAPAPAAGAGAGVDADAEPDEGRAADDDEGVGVREEG